MLCTPALIAELAAGFLYNERLINAANDITRVYVCDTADFVEIDTASPINKPTTWIKTTGCGGGQTAQRLEQPQTPDLREVSLSAQAVASLLAEFMQIQDAETTSRGVHCSAISDSKHILMLADDIGRHNTLDKLMGFILLQKPSLKPSILLTTGRISSEMLTKIRSHGCLRRDFTHLSEYLHCPVGERLGHDPHRLCQRCPFQRLLPPGAFSDLG